jgi:hypothetical protein
MLTGQISSHALHDVQAQTSSAVMRSNRLLAPMVISASSADGGADLWVAGGGHDLTGLQHDLAWVERLTGA